MCTRLRLNAVLAALYMTNNFIKNTNEMKHKTWIVLSTFR